VNYVQRNCNVSFRMRAFFATISTTLTIFLPLIGCASPVEFSTKSNPPPKTQPTDANKAQDEPSDTPLEPILVTAQRPGVVTEDIAIHPKFVPPTMTTQLICDNGLLTYTRPLRFIFMVDDSSSTLKRRLSPGTDPNFIFRRDSILNFIDKYKNKTNFSYSFGRFARNSSSFYNYASENPKHSDSAYFGTADEVSIAVEKYVANIQHGGDTPFRSALTTIDRLIESDTSATETNYIVVFLSDGAPTDLNGKVLDKNGVSRKLAELVADIVADSSLHEHKVQFNAIYFGPQSGIVDTDLKFLAEDAIKNLKVMTTVGSGQFVDTNKMSVGETLDIDDVVKVRANSCDDDGATLQRLQSAKAEPSDLPAPRAAQTE